MLDSHIISFNGLNVAKINPKQSINSSTVTSMDFLNDVSNRYPTAISLAAGRPPNDFIESERIGEFINKYITFRSLEGLTNAKLDWLNIGQYASTNGVIKDLIAKLLLKLENVDILQENIILTNGFQEALLIELLDMAKDNSALISMDPTYVGLSGAAMVTNLPMFVITKCDNIAEGIEAGAKAALNNGFSRLGAYIIPDFDNPTGRSLNLNQRLAILDVAEKYSITIFEDTAYRLFNYDNDRLPSLLNLDKKSRVVQLGSFSKTFMPGVRVGYSVRKFSKEYDKQNQSYRTAIKSFTSVTTSPIVQSIVGGFLLDIGFDLSKYNSERLQFCKINRDAMVATLNENLNTISNITWSKPQGGFFLVVNIPFEFDVNDTLELAEQFNVIVTPMSFFSPTGSCRNQIRLSFSNNSKEVIEEGTFRFASYLKYKLNL